MSANPAQPHSQAHAAAVPSSVRAKLGTLRRAIRSWHLADGLSHVLVWFVGLCTVDLVLDWFFRMDVPQRAICSALIVGVLFYVIVRRLLVPLTRPLSDDALIVKVEEEHRGSAESIISATQFARAQAVDKQFAEHRGLSPQMIDAAIQQGSSVADQTPFHDVVDRGSFGRNVSVIVAFLAVIGGAIYVSSLEERGMFLRIWFDRNVAFGDSAWPQDTYFEIKGVVDNKLSMPRGDDWEQAVAARGVVPDVVYVEYRPAGGRTLTQEMTQRGEDSFHAVFKNTLKPFRFRVYGGDAVTPWVDVELVDRPSVQAFELTVNPPDYVGTGPNVAWSFKPQTAANGGGASDGATGEEEKPVVGTSAVYALKGSWLALSGTTNKPLASASLRFGKETVDVLVNEDRTGFTAAIPADKLASGAYNLELLDQVGLKSRRPTRFTVKLRTDRSPVVRSKLDGIGGMVVANARIPIQTAYSDDFAITEARMQYQWRGESEESPKGEGSQPFTHLGDKLKEKSFSDTYAFEIEPLKLPVGSFFTFHVEAKDNDTITGPKEGKSTTFFVKVVTEQDLRNELLRREQEQRQEFERLLRHHTELMADSQGILAATKGKADLTDAQRTTLTRLNKRQRLVAIRCRAIAQQFASIKAEVENNRLEEADGPIQERVNRRIINPLQRLSRDMVPKAADGLDATRRTPKAADRDALLAATVEQQRDIERTMRDVLKYMVKWEGYQEAVNLALEVMSAQQQVNAAVRKAILKKLEGVFGD